MVRTSRLVRRVDLQLAAAVIGQGVIAPKASRRPPGDGCRHTYTSPARHPHAGYLQIWSWRHSQGGALTSGIQTSLTPVGGIIGEGDRCQSHPESVVRLAPV